MGSQTVNLITLHTFWNIVNWADATMVTWLNVTRIFGYLFLCWFRWIYNKYNAITKSHSKNKTFVSHLESFRGWHIMKERSREKKSKQCQINSTVRNPDVSSVMACSTWANGTLNLVNCYSYLKKLVYTTTHCYFFSRKKKRKFELWTIKFKSLFNGRRASKIVPPLAARRRGEAELP